MIARSKLYPPNFFSIHRPLSLSPSILEMNPHDPVEVAWQCYNQLMELSQRLWDAYEQPFVERCMLELKQPPEELQIEDEDIEDDIPF